MVDILSAPETIMNENANNENEKEKKKVNKLMKRPRCARKTYIYYINISDFHNNLYYLYTFCNFYGLRK